MKYKSLEEKNNEVLEFFKQKTGGKGNLHYFTKEGIRETTRWVDDCLERFQRELYYEEPIEFDIPEDKIFTFSIDLDKFNEKDQKKVIRKITEEVDKLVYLYGKD